MDFPTPTSSSGGIKKRIPQCVQRLAKLASLASLPTIHVETEILQEITPLLSSFGAAPDFAAANADHSGFYVIYNHFIYFVQVQKKWELGSISNSGEPVQLDVPVIVYKVPIEHIVSFVTSTIEDDFLHLVHKDDSKNLRSLSDIQMRWLRFQSPEHIEEFVGHCLLLSAPALMSKAKLIMFQTASSSNMSASLSISEIAAETERIVAESQRTLVVTDLVVRSVSDVLTKVKEEVISATQQSAAWNEKWGTKYNKIQSVNYGESGNTFSAVAAAAASKSKESSSSSADAASVENQFGVKASAYDFHRVAQNDQICARMQKAVEKKVLFSCEAHVSERTHEVIILTDKSLRVEKLRKDREVYVIPYNAIEEIIHEPPMTSNTSSSSSSSSDETVVPKILVKIDFSICTSIRGDVSLIFPPGPVGIRMKNLFLQTLTSIYEAVVVTHLPITESNDIFWERRGTMESQLVRMMRAIRPDESNERTQTISADSANTNPKVITRARLALYLCLKQPHRVISSLSASSSGIEKRLLSFLARTMHRVFLAHQEAVSQYHEQHKNDSGLPHDAYRNHGDLRCIPFVQPCVDYEVSSYRFNRNRIIESRERTMSQFPSSGGSNENNNNNNSNNSKEDFYSKSTADRTLLVPPSFGSSECFASLALKEYLGTAGASFVSLCLGRAMDDFLSNPQSLQQKMSLQHKQHWAAQFLKHLRDVLGADGMEDVLPVSIRVVISLIWQNFERERHRSANNSNSSNNNNRDGMNVNYDREDPVRGHFQPDPHNQQTNYNSNHFDEVTVIGGFLFSQFLLPAFSDPVGEGLITSELSDAQKKNLQDVTCLVECVLTQSDLPLAAHRAQSVSSGERTFLRRFIDNEVQDANRMIRCLIYPEIATDNPEDDGSAVPDFFPPMLPGMIFEEVELLPYGDPRTVESFWVKYVLKMPIDLHNVKLLNAFANGLNSVSLQVVTAAFTPQLHENGVDLSYAVSKGSVGSADGGGIGSGHPISAQSQLNKQQQQQNAKLKKSIMNSSMAFNKNLPAVSSALDILSQQTPGTATNGDDGFDDSPPSSPQNSPRARQLQNQKMAASVSWNPQQQQIGDGSFNSNSFVGTGGGGASTARSSGGGRMRSSTLIRAENTAAERSAIADRTIHRLTLEVKSLREQLAQAKQSELETRMAAARTMEQFSHSFAMQMSRTAAAAQKAQNKASGKKNNSNNNNHRRNHKKRNHNKNNGGKKGNDPDASSTASSSDDTSDSSDSNSSSSDDDDDRNDDLQVGNNSSFRKGDHNNSNASFNNANSVMGNNNNNPFIENKTGVNMNAVLSPEARWRHSLQALPAASRSTKGAGSETVFGCPMDAQCLAFLALPMNQSQHPQQGRGLQNNNNNNNYIYQQQQNQNRQQDGGRNSPWNNSNSNALQPQAPSNPLMKNNASSNKNNAGAKEQDFSNFSFINFNQQ